MIICHSTEILRAIKGDDSPNGKHYSRVRENSEVVIIDLDICISIYLTLPNYLPSYLPTHLSIDQFKYLSTTSARCEQALICEVYVKLYGKFEPLKGRLSPVLSVFVIVQSNMLEGTPGKPMEHRSASIFALRKCASKWLLNGMWKIIELQSQNFIRILRILLNLQTALISD